MFICVYAVCKKHLKNIRLREERAVKGCMHVYLKGPYYVMLCYLYIMVSMLNMEVNVCRNAALKRFLFSLSNKGHYF